MHKVVVIDTEGDGLAGLQPDPDKKQATCFHVLGYTYDGVKVETTHDDTDMCNLLYRWQRENRKIVIHNAMRHDVRLFRDLLGVELPSHLYVDTLALSWTLNHHRGKADHGLGSYGEDFGVPKPDVEFWEQQGGQTEAEFLEIMRNRVTEDVKINWKLWKQLEGKLGELYGTA